MMSPILLLLFALPVLSQTEKIYLAPKPTAPVACGSRINAASGRYEVFIPDRYVPTPVSSRAVFLGGTEKIGNDNFKIVSFVFTPGSEIPSCTQTQVGFEIGFSAGNTPVTNSNPQTNPQTTPTPAPTPSTITAVEVAETTKKKNEEAKKDAADLSVPDSPGFTILGLTPQTVIRPGTPREFATALINSLDENGNFQTGVAIDTAPFLLLFGDDVTLGEYRGGIKRDASGNMVRDPSGNIIWNKNNPSGYFTRMLSRTQFSLATTKGTTEDDKSAKIAAGVRFTLFDYGDPRLDEKLDQCFDRIAALIRTQAKREVPDWFASAAGDERFKAVLIRLIENNKTDYKKCVDQSKERNFASSSFTIGGAGSWISPTGDSGKFTNNGFGFWGTLAYGFEGIAGLDCSKKHEKAGDGPSKRCIKPQLVFHFRRRSQESVPDPLNTGLFTTRDYNLFGTRLRIGVPKWSVNFEGVYRAERYAGRTSSSSIEASLGADYKLASNLYLNFSIGGATKESNIPGGGKVFVRTAFNWGTSQKPLD
ncbi:MAG: hypothetical protein KA956_12645 [Pyrinomonadaceae bacterium]|nr:hypothetical protein [Acidobacteriota bacterium]MBP7377316.1 hypothetical protein [Pyrinomonadaceae bacterium]